MGTFDEEYGGDAEDFQRAVVRATADLSDDAANELFSHLDAAATEYDFTGNPEADAEILVNRAQKRAEGGLDNSCKSLLLHIAQKDGSSFSAVRSRAQQVLKSEDSKNPWGGGR